MISRISSWWLKNRTNRSREVSAPRSLSNWHTASLYTYLWTFYHHDNHCGPATTIDPAIIWRRGQSHRHWKYFLDRNARLSNEVEFSSLRPYWDRRIELHQIWFGIEYCIGSENDPATRCSPWTTWNGSTVRRHHVRIPGELGQRWGYAWNAATQTIHKHSH